MILVSGVPFWSTLPFLHPRVNVWFKSPINLQVANLREDQVFVPPLELLWTVNVIMIYHTGMRYVGVIRSIFHVLQLLPTRHTHNKKLVLQ